MHSGERQAAKMRMAYLKSILNQDISLFDTEASTGEVISAITSDIIIVQDAISEKVLPFPIIFKFQYSILVSFFVSRLIHCKIMFSKIPFWEFMKRIL